ncbi:MAG: DUF485 domain-containing protein [Candidatus Eremiobacteraeota bacterium]|nr:DUF485 domain-containing protein [Candidatus Eremiobacteraeota bacterium]
MGGAGAGNARAAAAGRCVLAGRRQRTISARSRNAHAFDRRDHGLRGRPRDRGAHRRRHPPLAGNLSPQQKTWVLVQHRPITPEQWDALAAEPEFRMLVNARRRFVIPATLFFIVYYLALPVSVGFAPQVMSRAVWGPLTLAYCFALSQFAMAWILLAAYLWRARRFDLEAARIRHRETHEIKG